MFSRSCFQEGSVPPALTKATTSLGLARHCFARCASTIKHTTVSGWGCAVRLTTKQGPRSGASCCLPRNWKVPRRGMIHKVYLVGPRSGHLSPSTVEGTQHEQGHPKEGLLYALQSPGRPRAKNCHSCTQKQSQNISHEGCYFHRKVEMQIA